MNPSDDAILQMPKVELHLHLDCSLSFEAVQQLVPGISEAEYREKYTNPTQCANMRDFFRCVSKSVDLMQNETGLRTVTAGLFDEMKRENVVYAEIRYAPTLHLRAGLLVEEVVEIVADSVTRESEASGIQAGVILCTLRNYSAAQSMDVVKLVERYIHETCIAGFDIAGDEANNPVDAHIPAFEYANRMGIPISAHAGEMRGADSVREVLAHLKPRRIGHGVRSIEDADMVHHLIEKDIHLEVCPSSNVKTTVYPDYQSHPIDALFKAGASVGVNTDGRSSAGVSLSDEYRILADTFGWEEQDFQRCNLAAVSHAFISTEEKKVLARKLGKV